MRLCMRARDGDGDGASASARGSPCAVTLSGMTGSLVGAGQPDPSLTRFLMPKHSIGFSYINLVFR